MKKKGIRTAIVLLIGIAPVLMLILLVGNKDSSTPEVGSEQAEVEDGVNLHTNGEQGRYIVNLISGDFEGGTEGKVLTDENCEPDEEGISRCHNDIQLADSGKEITVVNPHNMKNNRCLSPGETVQLSRHDDGKVVVELTEI